MGRGKLAGHGWLAVIAIVALPALAGCGRGLPPTSSAPGSSAAQGFAVSATSSRTIVSKSCHSSDPHHACLGIKYVAYVGADGTATVSEEGALGNLESVNSIWAPCDVAFQIDEYDLVDPASEHLAFHPKDASDLDTIRQDFGDASTLLVVTTGAWDRTGTLGSTSANAWTDMPGSAVYGAVLEEPVAMYPNLLAHELGHYLNLEHVYDETDVMNPIVYFDSTKLTADQCNQARGAIAGFWMRMLR